jgi:hypothetical protein
MFRLRRAFVAATAALLLSLPVAAQPPSQTARPGLAANVAGAVGAVLHRLWGGLRHLVAEVQGTMDPNGGS